MNHIASVLHTSWLVLGQTQQRLNGVAERFRSGGTKISATQAVVLFVVVAIVSVVLWRVARVVALRDGRSYFSSKKLFKELCRLHDLDWSHSRLLWKLAQARRIDQPARLFLESDWLDATELPASMRPFRAELGEIHGRLFAGFKAVQLHAIAGH